MAMNDRYLIDYLPSFMQEYTEMQKIMEAEQPEVDDLNDGVNNVWNNQYIQDATVYGVSRWESILGITPKMIDTLDERKFRILTKLNQELPYTLPKLNEVLTNLCGGADGYSIVISGYSITIKLALSNVSNQSEVEKILKKMLPANMALTIQIMYTTYEELEESTYGALETYTYDQIRNGVI